MRDPELPEVIDAINQGISKAQEDYKNHTKAILITPNIVRSI